jgi:hypothetical protein
MVVIDKLSIAIGIISFALMLVGFRYVAMRLSELYELGSYTKKINPILVKALIQLQQTFNALFFMCVVFTATSYLSPTYPDYAFWWRIVSRIPIMGVSFELWRYIFWYRSNVIPEIDRIIVRDDQVS